MPDAQEIGTSVEETIQKCEAGCARLEATLQETLKSMAELDRLISKTRRRVAATQRLIAAERSAIPSSPAAPCTCDADGAADVRQTAPDSIVS